MGLNAGIPAYFRAPFPPSLSYLYWDGGHSVLGVLVHDDTFSFGFQRWRSANYLQSPCYLGLALRMHLSALLREEIKAGMITTGCISPSFRESLLLSLLGLCGHA